MTQRWPCGKHQYKDRDLINGTELAKILGVSPMAISKARMAGRLDTFDDSTGKERYHKVLSVQQFRLSRDRKKVTTPTRAQKAAGYDNLTAQAVAYDPDQDVPRGEFGEPLPYKAELDNVGGKSAFDERRDLEVAKAEKEYQNARWVKIRADEAEGKLVDKQAAFNKVYAVASEAQDKLVSNYVVVAPKIVGEVQQRLVANGVDAAVVRLALKDMEHFVGEMIRKANLESLRNFTDAMSNEESIN